PCLLKLEWRLVVIVIQGEQRQHPWVGAGEAQPMLRAKGLEASTKQPGGQPGRPFVKIPNDQSGIAQPLLPKHVCAQQASGLRTPLRIARTQMDIEYMERLLR